MAFPYLSDLVRYAFGVNLPLPIPMFGLMIAIAFLVSLKVAHLEAQRLMPGQPQKLIDNVGIIGFLAGIVGARIFHLLEHPRVFLENPIGMMLYRGVFTIFCGLIIGVLVALIYARAKRAPLPTLCDACAPGLMLAYAIGRIGCQIAGDGDWGITANLGVKPDWLPTWFWAQTYDGNVLGTAIPPPGVYPTPLYETLMAGIAFAVLWRVRKHRHQPGWLFAFYVLLVGVERFLIEPIRVNTTFDLFGVAVTQAQLIATVCIVVGCLGMWWLARTPGAAARTTA
jgi:phosphatidylglycerol:prolipoprotein diacylglycerol transferase